MCKICDFAFYYHVLIFRSEEISDSGSESVRGLVILAARLQQKPSGEARITRHRTDSDPLSEICEDLIRIQRVSSMIWYPLESLYV